MSDTESTIADLLAIFAITKKSDLKWYCGTITVSQRDLSNLILVCAGGGGPWLHRAHHREFIPDHLKLSDEDLRNGVGEPQPGALRTMRKISAIFAKRRLLSGHIFFRPDLSEWHLFYFYQRDFSDRDNHWSGGSHIHLINHLWPGRTSQGVWNEFCTGNPQMRDALHIKFERLPRAPPTIGPGDAVCGTR